MIERCIADCIKVGYPKHRRSHAYANQIDMPYAYVVYDHARAEHVDRIESWCAESDIFLAGRYSEWEYYNSDHAFIAGQKAAASVKQSLSMGQSAGLRTA